MHMASSYPSGWAFAWTICSCDQLLSQAIMALILSRTEYQNPCQNETAGGRLSVLKGKGQIQRSHWLGGKKLTCSKYWVQDYFACFFQIYRHLKTGAGLSVVALKAYTIWDALFKNMKKKVHLRMVVKPWEETGVPESFRFLSFEVDTPMPLSVNLCSSKYYFAKT